MIWQHRLILRSLKCDNIGNLGFLVVLILGFFHPEKWQQYVNEATHEYIHTSEDNK
jgi:hypothetical protein